MAESRDRLLSGRYRLIDQLGRGGMGTVWWAYDEVGHREVAVKEVHLPPSLDRREQENLVRRTHREALAAGRLRHPGLIAMYDVVIEDARPWLIMEYVAARSLDDVLSADGPISPRRVADIGRQLLAALRAAHEAGIVHRDVKPSNVLLEGSGRVVLTDFGIATYEGATTLTQSGTFMGSPAYVAPEVARGERATPGSDLWSLGATLYAAVEGRPPYDQETAMATLSALVTSDPDPPVRAGPLRPLLDGLLRKEPARRLTAERAAELLAAAAGPPPAAQPRTNRLRRRRVRLLPVVTVCVLVLALVAGVVAGLKGWGDVRSATPAARPGTPPGPGTTASASVVPRPAGDALPATITDGSGRPVARRMAEGDGSWPRVTTLTLGLTMPARRPGDAVRAFAAMRVAVIVTCPAGVRRLSFEAYAVGGHHRPVSGTCTSSARDGTRASLSAAFPLPAGVSRPQVRVRVRPGAPGASGATIAWGAGVYEDLAR